MATTSGRSAPPADRTVEAVQWIDSVGHGGWVKPEDFAKTHAEMREKLIVTVGFVIHEDETAVTVCGSSGGVMGQAGECITIPKVAVRGRARMVLPSRFAPP